MLVWARVSDGPGAIIIIDDITFRMRLSGDTLRGTTATESDLVMLGEDLESTPPFLGVRTHARRSERSSRSRCLMSRTT
jgi:hypothetical protein